MGSTTRATPRQGRASRSKSAGDIRCLLNFLLQMHNKKMFDFENERQSHGVQRSQSWQISSSAQVVWHFCASSHRFRGTNMINVLNLWLSKFVKVTEYNFRSYHSWQISTSIKSWGTILAFSLSLTVFEIFTLQNSWHWKCRSKAECTTFAAATFDGKYLTSYLMANTWLPIWWQCNCVHFSALSK